MMCTRISVNVSYPFNYHRPQFNGISGEARIYNYEACDPQQPQTDINCQLVFLEDFFAVDSDGDTVTYSLVPTSNLFEMSDHRDLSSLFYRGLGISQETTIPLLIQVSVFIKNIYIFFNFNVYNTRQVIPESWMRKSIWLLSMCLLNKSIILKV